MHTRVLFAADLASRRDLYAELVQTAGQIGARTVLLGGDLFDGDPAAQVRFACTAFWGVLQRLRDAGTEHIGLLPGNSDWAAAFAALQDKDADGALCFLGAGRIVTGALDIVGYPFVPLTPFCTKDWEKLDHPTPMKSGILEGVATGFTSRDGTGSARPVQLPTDGSDTIAADLAAMTPGIDAGRTVFVSHCPPRNTQLDRVFGRHAGSHAIREFLENVQPLLSLHGHLTEIGQRDGVFAEFVGRTLAVNPGQGAFLHAVHFDPAAPAATLEHTVYGRFGAAVPAAGLALPDAPSVWPQA